MSLRNADNVPALAPQAQPQTTIADECKDFYAAQIRVNHCNCELLMQLASLLELR